MPSPEQLGRRITVTIACSAIVFCLAQLLAAGFPLLTRFGLLIASMMVGWFLAHGSAWARYGLVALFVVLPGLLVLQVLFVERSWPEQLARAATAVMLSVAGTLLW